jgi:hypothetical protein
VRGVGAALAIHAAWYLAAGTWHGFGDGALLRRELGDARIPVALAAGAAAVAMSYAGARAVIGVLAAMVPGARAARIGGTAAAIGSSTSWRRGSAGCATGGSRLPATSAAGARASSRRRTASCRSRTCSAR